MSESIQLSEMISEYNQGKRVFKGLTDSLAERFQRVIESINGLNHSVDIKENKNGLWTAKVRKAS